jgi:hypothetical protein
VEGLLGALELLRNLRQREAGREHHVGVAELRENLVGGV